VKFGSTRTIPHLRGSAMAGRAQVSPASLVLGAKKPMNDWQMEQN